MAAYELFSRIGGMTGRQNAVLQAKRKAAQGAAPTRARWLAALPRVAPDADERRVLTL